jgi:aminopeptidase N
MRALWDGLAVPKGLTLAEEDRTSLALELAVRGLPDAADILARELARVQNPDRRARLHFLLPAAAGTRDQRDAFFDALDLAENRAHETWVADALRLLNHPLREDASLPYLRPALERLEEIQRTGDIFFPQNWLEAALDGHSSPRAAKAVREFLVERPDYPLPLKRLILQSLYSVEAAARSR